MSTEIGRQAEKIAADYLKKQGFKILQQNWRTRWCEIDIVASRAKALLFVEVKYRVNTIHGTGFDYITPQKLRQMQFAAEFWLAQYGVEADCRLAAIELTGQPPQVTQWLPDVS